MSDDKKSKIESLGLDEALEDLKFLAQKVSDMSKDIAQKAVDQTEGVTDKMGDIVESTGDVLISAGETIKSTKKMFEDWNGAVIGSIVDPPKNKTTTVLN